MKLRTGLRLVAMCVSSATLFALSWYFFAREQPQPAPQSVQKSTQELLIGTWKVVEQEPPLDPAYSATIEFTLDGKVLLCMIHNQLGPNVPNTGLYEVSDNFILIDWAASPYGPSKRSELKIESVTDHMLITIGQGDKPTRTVLVREKSEQK